MSQNELSNHDQVLLGLVYSFQMAAMQQLGKIQDPASGEVHRDLQQARTTIDVLEMLKAKCRTDTPDEVLQVLDQTVMGLQLNYMDELKKDETDDTAEAETPPSADPGEDETAE